MAVLLDRSQTGTPAPLDTLQGPDFSGVKIIPIASGKGGVGKSTLAVQMALGLQKNGFRVGILDADIYGPSLPLLMGATGHKPEAADGSNGKRLRALEKHGLKLMSIGFFLKGSQEALMWRGPMAQKAMMQLISDTDWGDSQVILVDMPPGTGDIQLSLMQKLPLLGAVIVSTPQRMALEDVRKAATAFETARVPILGVVENMAQLFAASHLCEWAQSKHYKLLGRVPFSSALATACDEGEPSLAWQDVDLEEPFLSLARELGAVISQSETHLTPA